jgi:DNA-binding Lrp family transcriptional regulator
MSNTFLSPQQAGAISRQLGMLLQRGQLSHREYALGQCLLWRARKTGQAFATASYTALGRLAHISRKLVASGIRKLQELGIIQAIKCRVRVAWGRSVASRQGVSSYRLLAQANTEYPAAPTIQRKVRIETPEREVRKAQATLARVRELMEARLLRKGTLQI